MHTVLYISDKSHHNLRDSEIKEEHMETFGIIGFIFGVAALGIAQTLKKEVESLKVQLNDNNKDIEALKNTVEHQQKDS